MKVKRTERAQWEAYITVHSIVKHSVSKCKVKKKTFTDELQRVKLTRRGI
jgi:hypothetical protein